MHVCNTYLYIYVNFHWVSVRINMYVCMYVYVCVFSTYIYLFIFVLFLHVYTKVMYIYIYVCVCVCLCIWKCVGTCHLSPCLWLVALHFTGHSSMTIPPGNASPKLPSGWWFSMCVSTAIPPNSGATLQKLVQTTTIKDIHIPWASVIDPNQYFWTLIDLALKSIFFIDFMKRKYQ